MIRFFALTTILMTLSFLALTQARADTVLDRRVGAFEADFVASRSVKGEIPSLDKLSILSLDKKAKPLSGFEGKITVVNLWASWCKSCVEELTSLAQLSKDRKDINVVALNVNFDSATNDLKSYLEEKGIGLDFPAYSDVDRNVRNVLKTDGLPTTYILNSRGEALYQLVGSTNWNTPQAKDFFDYLNEVEKKNAGAQKH